ncbi:MOFRL family protein [Psychromarinibacter sp. C21-152]|uniref:MOFRL family protein n=1 Tax=Psychromarinibacter sediminicola TaxID=3033385 RepID=A0AAE3NVV5_9RHOB|nr:MOFRL family protein [Psychromarinibacter sediminicola]MDF0603231.1 MOFRL family protein [Psychromarinibacter sediminicola]
MTVPPFDIAAARERLHRNDAWTHFHETGGLIETGPTHTNVNDVRIALVLPDAAMT